MRLVGPEMGRRERGLLETQAGGRDVRQWARLRKAASGLVARGWETCLGTQAE